MRIFGVLARRIGWAVACVVFCVGTVAVALWCAQAVRTVPDGTLTPAESANAHADEAFPAAGERDSDAGDMTSGVEPGRDPRAYERHVIEVEGDESSRVIRTDLTDTAAHRRTAQDIAVRSTCSNASPPVWTSRTSIRSPC